MARPRDSQGRRLAELKKEVDRRGFDRHASVLRDVAELPVELQSATVAALVPHTTVQGIISFPPQIQRGWHYVPKQALLFTQGEVIHLLASIWPDQEPQVTRVEGCGLMYMRVTLQLLYGFLEIVAQGQLSTTRLSIEFNTVAWSCLSSPLRQLLEVSKAIRNMPANQPSSAPGMHLAVENLPIKFSNGVKIYGLLPGEEIEGLIFQPGVWKRWLYFFRRPVFANTLLLLTTSYMVVIQEELGLEQGWILSYIPRISITGMHSHASRAGNELCVQLERGNQSIDYKLTLKPETVEAWRKQWIQHGGVWQGLREEPS